jgi:hypothetical protein
MNSGGLQCCSVLSPTGVQRSSNGTPSFEAPRTPLPWHCRKPAQLWLVSGSIVTKPEHGVSKELMPAAGIGLALRFAFNRRTLYRESQKNNIDV